MLVDRFSADWAATLAPDWSWLVGVTLLAEVAVALDAQEAMPPLTAHLEPYTGQLVIVASGIACEGAIDRYLGLLSAARGDHAEARRQLAWAVDVEEAADAPALAARSRSDLAALGGN
jgi:hypothetical protein